MRSSASSVHGIVAETRQTHTDYQDLWRKMDSTATLSRGECPDPCLDRLLLLFWAHYIKDGPYLPFTENKGEGVANYIKKEGYFQM